jgi:hypothetical protein
MQQAQKRRVLIDLIGPQYIASGRAGVGREARTH